MAARFALCPSRRRPLLDHYDVPLFESVSVGLLLLAGSRAVKNRATKKITQCLDRVGVQRPPRLPTGIEGSMRPGSGEASKSTPARSASSWGPWACKAVQPRARVRTTVPAADLDSRPDLVKWESTAEKPGMKWVGDITLYPDLGGIRLPGNGRRLLHQESGRVCNGRSHARIPGLRGDRYGGAQLPREEGKTVFHSDRCCQYTSGRFSQHLKGYGILASTGRTGVCWDNAWVESVGATLKNARVYQVVYPARAKAIRDIASWIEIGAHDHERLHSSLGYRHPWVRSRRSAAAQDKRPDTRLSPLPTKHQAVQSSTPSRANSISSATQDARFGVTARITQRSLALTTAIWHNDLIGNPPTLLRLLRPLTTPRNQPSSGRTDADDYVRQ